MISAVLMNGNDNLLKFQLEIVPYGLLVRNVQILCKNPDMIPFPVLSGTETNHLRIWMIQRAHHFRKGEKDCYGGERPEAYDYIHAAEENWKLPDDNYRVGFPDENYISLYPGDFTYRKIHKLKK